MIKGRFKRILVVRGGAVGDFIVTLPVWAALRREYPDAELGALVPADRGELGYSAGVFEHWRCLDDLEWASFFTEGGELSEETAEWLSGFDAIVSYLHDSSGIWEANVKRVWRGEWLVGPGLPPDNDNRSVSKILLEPLTAWGIEGANSVPWLVLPDQADSLYALGVHPGSGSPAKNWPEPCWEQFLQHFLAMKCGELLMIGGEAEQDRLRWIESMVKGWGEIHFGKSLLETACVLRQCRMFVGHDSGITHLAAALGVPCVVLWGETNRNIWQPPQNHVTVLRGGKGLKEISVDAVLAAVSAGGAR